MTETDRATSPSSVCNLTGVYPILLSSACKIQWSPNFVFLKMTSQLTLVVFSAAPQTHEGGGLTLELCTSEARVRTIRRYYTVYREKLMGN
jgi:hypothetical protein